MLAFVKAFFLDLDLYHYTHPKTSICGRKNWPKKRGRKVGEKEEHFSKKFVGHGQFHLDQSS